MPRSRYKAIVDTLTAQIRAGTLSPGTRLPPHRELAKREGIALVTASRIYAELEQMGLVSGETGRGTFVREIALPPGHGIDQQVVAAGMTDLNFNYPSLPGQADLLRKALRQLALTGDLESLLRYQPHGGRIHERASVARHLISRGLSVEAQQVLLTSGAQHALTVTMMATLKPGDVIAADALTYPGFKVLAAALHLEVVAIPAGNYGPDLIALASLCKRRPVRAVYTMPTLHNPLGWVMPLSQREQLVSLANAHDFLIIEDAAYAYLVAETPPPVATLCPERTVYISGFSKNIATGLRIGFLASPPRLLDQLERTIRATTWNTAGILTAIVTAWLEDGTVTQLEAEKRRDAQTRQALAAKLLKALQPIAHPSAYFLWLPLPEGARADQIAAALLEEGISVSTAEPFATSLHVPHAIRIALGSTDLESLEAGLNQIARVVSAYI